MFGTLIVGALPAGLGLLCLGWPYSFGGVDSFCFSSDQSPVHEAAPHLFDSVMECTSLVDLFHLCFVLESDPTYVDPPGRFFFLSARGLEKMFSVESLEIPDKEKILNYDQDQIR